MPEDTGGLVQKPGLLLGALLDYIVIPIGVRIVVDSTSIIFTSIIKILGLETLGVHSDGPFTKKGKRANNSEAVESCRKQGRLKERCTKTLTLRR